MHIAVIGLGYVGLPLALALAKRYRVTGFDIHDEKIQELRRGFDRTEETEGQVLRETTLHMTSHPEDLRGKDLYIVAVPTPIDAWHRPDLTPVIKASETVGKALGPGAIVVYESTVYPGVTEDICGPLLAKHSGLVCGRDFHLGYSPERINPGDKEHTLERIVKVVSGQDARTLEVVAEVYGSVIEAGVHRAPSIRVAEAAKVIENTQRDLNIALMNELAVIFDRMGISTRDVLQAARTKWNFLPFSPGLVGGHCIGVDPYYLTTKAEELGYHPQVILAGRRINDGMGAFIGQKTAKLLIQQGIPVKGARVGVLGLTFKEDVHDLRNSKVPDILHELRDYGVVPLLHDPMADPREAREEYGVTLEPREALKDLDGLILAVSHQVFRAQETAELLAGLRSGGVLVDVKGMLSADRVPDTLAYWSL